MRASSDWRSARYLAAQRASKARRAVRDVDEAIRDLEWAARDYGALRVEWTDYNEITRWVREDYDMLCAPVRRRGEAASQRIHAAHRRMVKAAGE